MSIITVGIDLAKNVFAVHGVDDNGKPALVKPKVSREHLLPLIAQLPPCVIGMEACSGAHHWARQFRQYGHTVKLMAPKFVSPYRMSGKRGKNDAADAAAICEAVRRPHMRFVPVKEEHQQIILCLHRTRQGFVEERTATYNRLRGLISEFGIVLPQKVANLRRDIIERLEDLPGYVNQCVGDLLAHADALEVRIADYDRIIAKAAPTKRRVNGICDSRIIWRSRLECCILKQYVQPGLQSCRILLSRFFHPIRPVYWIGSVPVCGLGITESAPKLHMWAGLNALSCFMASVIRRGWPRPKSRPF